MKAALVQCPVWWTVDPPLGLAQAAGCLKQAGFEVRVFDLNVLLAKNRRPGYEDFWDWERFQVWDDPETVARFFSDHASLIDGQVQAVLRSDAPVIGFSVHHGTQWASLELARRLKAEAPSRKIVFGGQYLFSEDGAACMGREPCVDAVLRGAAEDAAAELFSRLAEGRDPPAGPPRQPEDLDSAPFADFSGFPLELYDVQERLPIQASRGCVWKCRFCSSAPFWKGYSRMGGERIFAELMHHKRLYPHKTHFEFYDLAANGDVSALRKLCGLIQDDWKSHAKEHFFGWKINAILRPEMDKGLLQALAGANCHDVIYGVESGSARVLRRMNKPVSIETAERVLRETREAGITTVGNFMFGFPGESEEDFQQTLDFLRRNRASFDRVYASATFTSLEQSSYLAEHAGEFGVREGGHHLYWETLDGANDYPVRLDRYERFRKLAAELGLDAYKGIDGPLERERAANLDAYRRHQDERIAAGRREHAQREVVLSNTPERVFLQVNGPCKADCVFCSRDAEYPLFSLDRYIHGFGPSLAPAISRARELLLTGSGELLDLPEARRILEYFNTRFPHVDKHLATNASQADPALWGLVAAPESRYTVQVSLHAATAATHREVTRLDAFERVLENVRRLAARRREQGSPRLHLMFVMNALNAHELPAFVRLAAGLGVDKVLARYFFVYSPSQERLSMFFHQEAANRALDEARAEAARLGVVVDLPPKFGTPKPEPEDGCCPEPWHQIMVNTDGRVLPCDAYGPFDADMRTRTFEEVWNGKAYQELRTRLRDGRGCAAKCQRRRPASVDDWASHVIRRGA
jgi:radical SAM superfamily enzyme YgiQ (UPF0313 family)